MPSVRDCYKTKEQQELKRMKKISVEINKQTENKIDLLLKNTSASSTDSLIALLVDKAAKNLKQTRRLR